MNRRAYLRAVATAGAVGVAAGCQGFSDDPGATAGSEATLTYPLFPPTVYDLSSERVSDPDRTPTAFADLSSEVRLEFATVVHRGSLRTGNPPALQQEDVGYVRYRDVVWGASGGSATRSPSPSTGRRATPTGRTRPPYGRRSTTN